MTRKEKTWPTPPLFEAAWRDLPDDLAQDLRRRLTAGRVIVPSLAWSGRLERFRVAALPFWPGWIAGEAVVAIPDEPDPVVAAFLYGPHGPELLDGQSDVVHGINGRRGIALETEHQRQAYLRFFTSAVRGDDGPFFLIESDERLTELTGKKPRGAARGLAHPIRSRGDGDARLYDAVVLYGEGLFRSTFSMSSGGMVMMEEDEVIVSDHPRPALVFDGGLRRPAA